MSPAQTAALHVACVAGIVGAGRNVVGSKRYTIAAPALAALVRRGLLAASGRDPGTGAPVYKLTDAGRNEAEKNQ